MKNRKAWLMKEVQDRYNWLMNEKEYEVFGVFLYGSQNYQMDVYDGDYMSDVDVKVFVMPTFKNLLRGNKMVSKTLEWPDGSHLEVKDVRLMSELMVKSNPAYLELLFTEFYVLNPDYEKEGLALMAMAEDVASANKGRLMNSLFGMFMEKKKALRHPYPTLVDKLEKYGYDPKQMHHMRRLYEFAHRYFAGESFKSCLVPKNVEFEVEVKKGFYKNEEVDDVVVLLEDDFRTLRAWAKEQNFVAKTEVFDKMRDYVYDVVGAALKAELLKS